MLTWMKQMRLAFGTSFLWLVSLIYFTQGFRSFVWTAVSYQLKDILKLSPSASQFLVSVAFFPWSIKPVYGIFSDCIPIRGRKRVPYLVVATIFSLVPWLTLGLNLSVRSSRVPLMIVLTIQNFGSAMADVVIDAMIAEAVHSERMVFAGDLQSVSWSAMALGGICGSLLGGYMLAHVAIDMIFLLFSILPAIQLLSCFLIKEAPSSSSILLDNANSNSPDKVVHSTNEDTGGQLDFTDIQQKLENTEMSRGSSSTRRKKRPKDNKERKIIKETEIKCRSLIMRSFLSLKSAILKLSQAFRQPIILRPMAWFFLARVTIPNLSSVMFYYHTEVLHLEPSFLGTARVVGWLGLMLGTYMYNQYLKHMKLRRILMWAHLGLATLNIFDLVLVSRFNVQYGIPDHVMVLWGSALSDVVNQLKMMPFLIISGQLCPPGIEGTLFALFMSINNLGNTLGSFLGAGLASILNISSNSFDNLFLGISIQATCTFIPIAFLFLIPKEGTGLST